MIAASVLPRSNVTGLGLPSRSFWDSSCLRADGDHACKTFPTSRSRNCREALMERISSGKNFFGLSGIGSKFAEASCSCIINRIRPGGTGWVCLWFSNCCLYKESRNETGRFVLLYHLLIRLAAISLFHWLIHVILWVYP